MVVMDAPSVYRQDLYLVGMGVKGSGVAGGLIPLGVRIQLGELGFPLG